MRWLCRSLHELHSVAALDQFSEVIVPHIGGEQARVIDVVIRGVNDFQ